MKLLKLSIALAFIANFSFAQNKEAKVMQAPIATVTPAAAPKQSAIKWDKEIHDFGDIEKGKPVTYEFTFTNTTNETVLITTVKPACGCTAANYTKTPVKPGEKGMVAATFNAASAGAFQKSVTIITNEGGVDTSKTVSFKGKVIDTSASNDKKADIRS
ncbi:DUF1573 domain-containing protein [Flavobacterium cucumis]|uniref:DUF1573 domain-containing protein n=1 Tax=Flavobacterium cucumis TaxID=416016 RepID=A0A1M7ZU61_9FLAO|nr:DUF1573 domain-containing protein [Flavobacterium cucumis]SHO72386.1 Protein of unknown function [Flavobacterium cucumis]